MTEKVAIKAAQNRVFMARMNPIYRFVRNEFVVDILEGHSEVISVLALIRSQFLSGLLHVTNSKHESVQRFNWTETELAIAQGSLWCKREATVSGSLNRHWNF